MRKIVQRTLTATAILVITAAMGMWGPGTAQAHSTKSCAVTWGSQPKAGPVMAAAEITGVRAGRHACYDRLVIDVTGSVAGAYDVSYVHEVTMDGSGDVVPVSGGAKLAVVVRAPVVESDPLFRPGVMVDVERYSTFRKVVWAGSFEGLSTIGLGVRARLPFRAFVIPGPGSGSRLVVDVAHRW